MFSHLFSFKKHVHPHVHPLNIFFPWHFLPLRTTAPPYATPRCGIWNRMSAPIPQGRGPVAQGVGRIFDKTLPKGWKFPYWFLYEVHSCKLTFRHGESTILMVFTRKDGIFMGYVSFREGTCCFYNVMDGMSWSVKMWWCILYMIIPVTRMYLQLCMSCKKDIYIY